MHGKMTVAAAAVLAGATLVPVAGRAQSNPTADQMVKALAPTGHTGTETRGIRIGNQTDHARAPSVSLNILFASGSAELTPEALQALDELGRALSASELSSYRFRIEGHTDTVGSPDMNRMLSERRAATVVGYLEGKFNIAGSRLQSAGMGEQGLLVPTPAQTAEPRNRRVLVVNLGS
jgi:outer membrane protein OmpA-like peptidoglycan-associated protein